MNWRLAVKGIQKRSSEVLSGKSAMVSTLFLGFVLMVANIHYAMLKKMNNKEVYAVICIKNAIFVKNIEFWQAFSVI